MAHVQPKHAVPYVFSKKSCKEHMAFITKYFKGTETYIIESHDGTGRVMHASMTVHGGPIYLSDRIVKDGKGEYGSPDQDHPSSLGTHLYLGFDTYDEGKAAWDLAQEGKVRNIMDFVATEWGAYYGVCEDPFGSVWAFSCPDPNAKVPHGSGDKEKKDNKTKATEDIGEDKETKKTKV